MSDKYLIPIHPEISLECSIKQFNDFDKMQLLLAAIKTDHDNRTNKDIVNKYMDELEKLSINAKIPHYVGMLEYLAVIQRSMYYSNIQRLLKVFDRKQLLFIHIEDLNTNLYHTLIKICKFIEYDVDKGMLKKICDEKNRHQTNKAFIQINVTEKEKMELYEIFKDENEKLFKFLGRDLGWIMIMNLSSKIRI